MVCGVCIGKSTRAKALSQSINSDERVLIIEDTSKIQIEQGNLVGPEARCSHTNLPELLNRNLLKATRRLWHESIILGEVRGGDASGLDADYYGSVSTIQLSSVSEAISRFTTFLLVSGIDLRSGGI